MYQQKAVTSPVTQQGIVVFNAQKDAYSISQRMQILQQSDTPEDLFGYKFGQQDDLFHVLPHEIAMCHEVEFRSGENRDSRPIITSLNGIVRKDAGAKLTFAGIVATRALHDSYNAVGNEDDCVVQIGGMVTILNNGAKTIPFNAWVMWQFPLIHGTDDGVEQERVYGAPDGKQQVMVHPYDKSDRIGTETDHVLSGDYPRDRIFGRAMCSAEPGQQLDILLGAHCL
jgi:hypothetical protein